MTTKLDERGLVVTSEHWRPEEFANGPIVPNRLPIRIAGIGRVAWAQGYWRVFVVGRNGAEIEVSAFHHSGGLEMLGHGVWLLMQCDRLLRGHGNGHFRSAVVDFPGAENHGQQVAIHPLEPSSESRSVQTIDGTVQLSNDRDNFIHGAVSLLVKHGELPATELEKLKLKVEPPKAPLPDVWGELLQDPAYGHWAVLHHHEKSIELNEAGDEVWAVAAMVVCSAVVPEVADKVKGKKTDYLTQNDWRWVATNVWARLAKAGIPLPSRSEYDARLKKMGIEITAVAPVVPYAQAAEKEATATA